MYSGFKNITPLSSSKISCSDFPVSPHINGISTLAFSPIDTANASLAVETAVTLTWGLIVLLVNISALRFNSPFSPIISSEHKRQYELSSENTSLFALELRSPYFFVNESYI